MTTIKIKFGLSAPGGCTFFRFMEEQIDHLHKLGKERTSESYSAALNSFRRFRKGNDILLRKINGDLMIEYEKYLECSGVTPNSSSFYMRSLRAVYNRAADKGLTKQNYPFKYVYTGVCKTVKRAVPLKVIRAIKDVDLSSFPWLDFARDMFMFSFYTRGMSFIDIAYLRKSDLSDGILSYRRRKTGQQLFIKWEPCMQEITNKYAHDSTYLLPIIKRPGTCDERRQYLYASHNVNRNLKIIGDMLNVPIPLTMYVARHSWASIARSKKVSLAVISEGMGHDSEKTTRIYLSSIDNIEVDKANKLILKSLL